MDALKLFCVGVALLYHEARHARRAKHLPGDAVSWGMIRSLPDDRHKAWQQVRPFFLQSANAKTPKDVEKIFASYFRKTLAELEQLFREASWPANFGGAKWADSAAVVRRLGDAMDAGDTAKTDAALSDFKKSQHNTGTLVDKYLKLESG